MFQLLKSSIGSQKLRQNVRDQGACVDLFRPSLRIKRGIAVNAGFKLGRQSDVHGHIAGVRQLPQLDLQDCGSDLFDSAGDRIKSLFTMMRNGNPGRTVSVG